MRSRAAGRVVAVVVGGSRSRWRPQTKVVAELVEWLKERAWSLYTQVLGPAIKTGPTAHDDNRQAAVGRACMAISGTKGGCVW